MRKTKAAVMKSLICKITVALFCLSTAAATAADIPADHGCKIFILNSYHKQFKRTDDMVNAVKKFLNSQIDAPDIYTEYMDTKRISSDEYLQLFSRTTQLKYNNVEFNVIISTGDDALQFLINYGDELFAQTPVVFCGINDFNSSILQGKTNFTGITETLEIGPTIDLIMKLHPKTKRIAVISDNTPTGLSQRKTVADVSRLYKNLEFEYLKAEDLTTDELLERLAKLSNDTIALLTTWSRDKTGDYYPEEKEDLISSSSAVPIYGLTDVQLGKIIAAGKLLNASTHGRQAAEIALRIIKGEKPADIPVNTQPDNPYMFDYNQLKRWQINMTNLPKTSIIINEPQSFYYLYKTIIWTVAVVITSLLAMALILSVNILHRRKTEKALAHERSLLTALMDNIPDHIYFKDTQSRFTRINKAMADYLKLNNRDQAVGKTNFDFFTNKQAEQTLSEEKQIMKTAQPLINTEEKQTGPDGQKNWVSTTRMPLYNRKGRIVGTFALSRDTTERKNAEKILTQHVQKLEHFNDMAVSRELQMIELKRKINNLLSELGLKEKYPEINNKTEIIDYASNE